MIPAQSYSYYFDMLSYRGPWSGKALSTHPERFIKVKGMIFYLSVMTNEVKCVEKTFSNVVYVRSSLSWLEG